MGFACRTSSFNTQYNNFVVCLRFGHGQMFLWVRGGGSFEARPRLKIVCAVSSGTESGSVNSGEAQRGISPALEMRLHSLRIYKKGERCDERLCRETRSVFFIPALESNSRIMEHPGCAGMGEFLR